VGQLVDGLPLFFALNIEPLRAALLGIFARQNPHIGVCHTGLTPVVVPVDIQIFPIRGEG
jgi:hypothetical protein